MKIKIILSALIIVIFFTSCNDYLNATSPSEYDDNTIFSNTSLTEDAVLSIYSYFAQTNSHRGRYMPYYGMNTDAEIYYDLSNPTSDEKSSLCSYSAFQANGWMGSGSSPNSYTCFFDAIEDANCCIQGIRNYGNPKKNPDMAYLLGESLTLRAQFYYDLIRAWGDVPARFKPVTGETLYSAKSDRDIIYKQIIADLQEAANYLPWPGTTTRTSSVERVNKAYALGLRARLILMAEGYSERPNSLDDPTNYTVRRSTDPELTSDTLLESAYKDLQNIINSAGIKLNSTYESIWNELAQDIITTGRESIFEIPFAAGRGRFFYHFGVYHKTTSPHLSTTNKGGQNCPAPTLYYEYDNGDERRDINCVPYKWNGDGYTLENLGTGQASPGFNFGKYDYERMLRTVSSNDDGVNLPVLRYADVLLMASELANDLGDMKSAKLYLTQVRQRAFSEADRAEHVTAYINTITTKEDMLKAIQKERLLEFPGEMLRKQDLIRWNILGKEVKSTVAKMKALKDRTGDYSTVPHNVYYRTFDKKLEYYGLARGENAIPNGKGWTKLNYDFITAAVKDDYINNFYINDPDTKQFWPIFQTDIDASNGVLMNNYGYK